MNLGERIYRLRTEKNLSQGDLAELLEVSRQWCRTGLFTIALSNTVRFYLCLRRQKKECTQKKGWE